MQRKGGRPKRAPGEALQRVSLNLRPGHRVGLELIARVRGGSLSQACEFGVSLALREVQIEGRSAQFITDEVMARVQESKNHPPQLFFPRSVLNPNEVFAKELWEALEEEAISIVSTEDFSAWAEQHVGDVFEFGLVSFGDGASHSEALDVMRTFTGLRARQDKPDATNNPIAAKNRNAK